jgi:hypothetical protein
MADQALLDGPAMVPIVSSTGTCGSTRRRAVAGDLKGALDAVDECHGCLEAEALRRLAARRPDWRDGLAVAQYGDVIKCT